MRKRIAKTERNGDAALARAAAEGCRESFARLYETHRARVYRICQRMLGDSSLAEDLTHDVFVNLLTQIGSFRGESAFVTWLHRLTVNQVLMHFRKRHVRHERTAAGGQLPDRVLPGTENPDRMPVVDRIAIGRAVEQLPPGYRTVFLLHDVDGYDHSEVARMLGVTEGTSKSQLHMARRQIRNQLTTPRPAPRHRGELIS